MATSPPPPSSSAAVPTASSSSSSTTKAPPATGRVLRLHFACRAALPPGSALRVTSSTLWAPSVDATQPETDQDIHGASHGNKEDGDEGEEYHHLLVGGKSSTLHASSVEMVTDPESYPVWRTRRPVTLVADGRQAVQRHKYRYMVVTPGADIDPEYGGKGHAPVQPLPNSPSAIAGEEDGALMQSMMEEEEDIDSVHLGGGGGGSLGSSPAFGGASSPPDLMGPAGSGGGASTTDDYGIGEGGASVDVGYGHGYGPPSGSTGALPVMMWEDPFGETPSGDTPAASAVSLPSLHRTAIRTSGGGKRGSLVDLPYRTLDIDVSNPMSDTFGKEAGGSSSALTGGGGDYEDMDEAAAGVRSEYTPDGVRIDQWNESDDYTFRPFVEKMAEIFPDTDLEDEEGFSTDEYADTASSHSSQPAPPPPNNRLFLVCYHLPILLSRDPETGSWSACWSESLIAKTEQSGVSATHETYWIGTVSTVPAITTDEDKDAVRAVLKPMGCTPLFLNWEIEDAHYLGCCKQVLWPAFHNIDLLDLSASGWGQREMSAGPDSAAGGSLGGGGSGGGGEGGTQSDWDQSRLDHWWNAYGAVNRAFADALESTIGPRDTVWVHDYHLSLLPKMLDERERAQTGGMRTVKMVFFLHIPFPTSQVFRELEHGEEILEGMLHADVIGFHAFDHARHFLNASKRILGLSYESLVGGLIGVRYRGKKVLVTMQNVSIEPDIVDAALALPSVKESTQVWRQKYAGRSIIAGVDVCQRLSGIGLKLLAYERLLADYPVWNSKVVMVQKCLIPGSRRVDESDTLREVRFLVRRIQDTFGQQVLDYEEIAGSALPIDQRLAIWAAADCLMAAPIREALNLSPLEYVFARKDPAVPGVVISSEFSAVCSILNGALRVNPFDVQMTVTSIDKALSMPLDEREARRARDIDFVSSCPSGLWTKNVLRDLNDATLGSYADGDDGVGCKNAAERIEAVDSPDAILARENELAMCPLDLESVTAAYSVTKSRVIILDFNGTLVVKEPPGKYLKREILGTTGYKPAPSVIRALTDLCADPRNIVYVVSGDSQKNLEDAVGNIPGLGLAASNGACFAHPVKDGSTVRTWQAFDLGVDWDAVKKVALPVFSKYTARTNGSFVKLTHSSIGWSYYSCDPEWGSLQASYLVPELEKELMAFDVRFVTLKGVVEVVPRKLNKGLIVARVLSEAAAAYPSSRVDFILCMGDDISDEKMFTSVFSFVSEVGPGNSAFGQGGTDDMMEVAPPAHKDSGSTMYSFVCAVGKKPSHASLYVNGASDVADVLVSLSSGEVRSSQSMSWESEEGADLFA